VKRNEYSISRKDYSVLTSIFGAVVAPAMFFFGFKLTSAIDSSLLSNGEVIFSILLVLTIVGVDYESPSLSKLSYDCCDSVYWSYTRYCNACFDFIVSSSLYLVHYLTINTMSYIPRMHYNNQTYL
jgi:hypothetical protein